MYLRATEFRRSISDLCLCVFSLWVFPLPRFAASVSVSHLTTTSSTAWWFSNRNRCTMTNCFYYPRLSFRCSQSPVRSAMHWHAKKKTDTNQLLLHVHWRARVPLVGIASFPSRAKREAFSVVWHKNSFEDILLKRHWIWNWKFVLKLQGTSKSHVFTIV